MSQQSLLTPSQPSQKSSFWAFWSFYTILLLIGGVIMAFSGILLGYIENAESCASQACNPQGLNPPPACPNNISACNPAAQGSTPDAFGFTAFLIALGAFITLCCIVRMGIRIRSGW